MVGLGLAVAARKGTTQRDDLVSSDQRYLLFLSDIARSSGRASSAAQRRTILRTSRPPTQIARSSVGLELVVGL